MMLNIKEDALSLLERWSLLSNEEKIFIESINSWKERLDFIKHNKIMKSINNKKISSFWEDYLKKIYAFFKRQKDINRMNIRDHEEAIDSLASENRHIDVVIDNIRILTNYPKVK